MVFITIIAYLIANLATVGFALLFWMKKPRTSISKKVWFGVGLGFSLLNIFVGGFLSLLFIGVIMGISELTDLASASDYEVVFRWLSGFTGLTWIIWIAGAVKFLKTKIEPVIEIIHYGGRS